MPKAKKRAASEEAPKAKKAALEEKSPKKEPVAAAPSPKKSPKQEPAGSPKKSPKLEPVDPETPTDPYLLEEATYLEKETRWRNKQRTLVLTSRGTTSQFRHVMEDLRRFMPHHKTEPKFEKKSTFRELAEVCELKSCNNCIYFEARKKKDLYMWIARTPNGPSIKFQVHNIHTLAEIRYSGNCLKGSRPLVTFDKSFDKDPFLSVMKELLMQAFGTPRNHPHSKPFTDHVISFFHSDHKIFFRHYQIAPFTDADRDDPEKQSLTEIGPRFVMDPIRMLSGAWSGACIYENPHYMSPTALRVAAKAAMGRKYTARVADKRGRELHEEENQLSEDELLDVFK
jgi:ribosome biogenesis protein BRX1